MSIIIVGTGTVGKSGGDHKCGIGSNCRSCRCLEANRDRQTFKGVDELGTPDVAAAITNVIFNVTDKHLKDLPLTLDKLL